MPADEKPDLGVPLTPDFVANIGVTPFRAGEDAAVGFYDSDKYVQFQNDVRKAADHYGVRVHDQQRVEGIWQGQTEPSVALEVHDGETGVKAFAADIGKGYNQDSVLVFAPQRSGDLIATFDTHVDQDRVFAAMAFQGLEGGRLLADGRLQIIGTGEEFVGQIDRLAGVLGVEYDVERGAAIWLEREAGDYDQAIQAFKRPGLGDDPSASMPGSFDLSRTDSDPLGVGNVNEVFLVDADRKSYVVKPDPSSPDALDRMMAEFGDYHMRENVEPGLDLERERAAYIVARVFNDIDPDNFHVNTPLFRIGEVTRQSGDTVRAGISEFLPGTTEAREMFDLGGWRQTIANSDLRASALYDAIIGNTDRHAGNFLFDEQGKAWMIDHGLAFPERNLDYTDGNAQLIQEAVSRFGEDLDGDELAFLEKLRARWPEIDAALTPLLGADARQAMKERIDYMTDGVVREPPGDGF